MIISISGVDGSGKSSLVNNLHQHYSQRGHKSKIFILGEYLILDKPLRVLKQLYTSQFKPSENTHQDCKNDLNPFLNTKPKSKIYSLLLIPVLIDTWIYYLWLKIHSLRKTYVITDRYFYDRAPGFIYYKYITQKTGKLFYKLVPKPDIAFFIDTPPDLCAQRELIHKHDLEFYESLRKIFLELNDITGMEVMETVTLSQQELLAQVLEAIEHRGI